jgi:hypothetical protein
MTLSFARLAGIPFITFVVVSGAAASDISGKWTVDVNYDSSSISGGAINCVFKQEGEQLTGNCDDVVTLTGEVKEQDVTFTIRSKDTPPWTTTFTGTVNEAGTAISGTFRFTDERGHFTASKRS